MKRNLQNDKLVMKIIRKQTCKMITQDYDKSVSKKQESDQKWLIIFLGKVCIRKEQNKGEPKESYSWVHRAIRARTPPCSKIQTPVFQHLAS